MRTRQIEQEFEDKEKRLMSKLRAQMDQLISEQTQAIGQLQGEFGNASGLMDQKYRTLNEKFVELQGMYDGRPSRPEDLELIKQVQDEIVQKEAELKKAAEDMKFYKLELINREHSYNNMFGNNPNVGLMNPVGMLAGGVKPGAKPPMPGKMNNLASRTKIPG